MKTNIFFLSIFLLGSLHGLFAQSPVLELKVNETYISNKTGKQHFTKLTNATLFEPKIYLQAQTKSDILQYGTLVIDLNNNQKIEANEIMTKPFPSNKKGIFETSIEIHEKAWAQIKGAKAPIWVQFRVTEKEEISFSSAFFDRRLGSISWSIGEPKNQPIIQKLMINETTAVNEKEQQHARSNQIVIVEDDFLALAVNTTSANPGKLYGTLVLDLNGNGKIEQDEILSEPFLANEDGSFKTEVPLPKEVIEALHRLEEPRLLQFRVSENPEELYSPDTYGSGFSSFALRAVGPVIVIDTSQIDQHPSGGICVSPNDTTITIGLTNFKPKTMRVDSLLTPGVVVQPDSITPNLPPALKFFSN